MKINEVQTNFLDMAESAVVHIQTRPQQNMRLLIRARKTNEYIVNRGRDVGRRPASIFGFASACVYIILGAR